LEELTGFLKQPPEFSQSNIKLLEYNKNDMEMLMGKESEICCHEENPITWVCQNNHECQNKITQLMGAGELLMNEYEDIKRFMASHGYKHQNDQICK